MYNVWTLRSALFALCLKAYLGKYSCGVVFLMMYIIYWSIFPFFVPTFHIPTNLKFHFLFLNPNFYLLESKQEGRKIIHPNVV